jgi:hypothetical protein
LTHPNAVFDNRVYSTSNRTVGANCALHFDFASANDAASRIGSLSFFDQAQLRCSETYTNAQTRTAQKRASVKGGQRLREAAAQAVHKR